jgi:hypothetical protein
MREKSAEGIVGAGNESGEKKLGSLTHRRPERFPYGIK